MACVVIWFVCGIISAAIAHHKGEGCMGFVVGCIFGPLGILVAIFSSGNRRKCPNCLELMHKDARVCPHCQRDARP